MNDVLMMGTEGLWCRHRLKGVAGTIGAWQLQHEAGDVEAAVTQPG